MLNLLSDILNMDQSGQIILKNIINNYGSTIYQEKKKLEALIRDLFPQEYVRERNALIITVKAGLIEKYFIKQSIDCSYSQLFHLLSNEYCLDPQLSNWVIHAWQHALSEDPLVKNENGIGVIRKIKVNVREQCNCKEFDNFLTNFVWISDNHIGVILSLIRSHDSFRKINHFSGPEQLKSLKKIECIRCDSQKLDNNHLVLIFDVNDEYLKNWMCIQSTKNITISNNGILSGGKSLRKLTVQNGALIEEWVIQIKNDCSVITPTLWRDNALTLLFTETSAISAVVSFSMSNGKINSDFTVPFQLNSTNSNLCIGDTLFFDYRVNGSYQNYYIVKLDLKTSKIIWKSDYFSENNSNKPFFIYSSSIIPDNEMLLYCLGSSLISIDRMTGNTLWEHPLPEMPDEYYLGSERRIVSHDASIIIAGLHEIEAINKKTGEIIWISETIDDPDLDFYTSNPILYNDYLIIGGGVGDGDWEDGGPVSWMNYFFVVIDAITGKLIYTKNLDFAITGNPNILGNKMYCWERDSLIEIALSF